MVIVKLDKYPLHT